MGVVTPFKRVFFFSLTVEEFFEEEAREAAGVVAHEAFKLEGDRKGFPELAKEGLQPWKPQALYRSAWFNREEATMTLSLAGIEPASGKSIAPRTRALR